MKKKKKKKKNGRAQVRNQEVGKFEMKEGEFFFLFP